MTLPYYVRVTHENMLTVNLQPKKDDEKEKFTATFDNGTLEQLKELATFLEEEDFSIPKESGEERLKGVLTVAIATLQSAKERQSKSATE